MTPTVPGDRPLMLDLFCGLGGASAAMRERGWEVVGVDNDPRFDCEVHADVLSWQWDGRCPDLLWASPPCEEFSREFMPWCKTGKAPSLDLVRRVLALVNVIGPRWWVVENTRGSVRWISSVLGHPVCHCGGGRIYLWGQHPPMLYPQIAGWKEGLSSTRAAERGRMPYELSRAFAVAVENAIGLVSASDEGKVGK